MIEFPYSKNSKDRLGYYMVGQKKFYNKTLALIESYHTTRQDPVWVFNDDVYGRIDWTIPIEENLSSIYRRRAQQLRDQYDYLVLHFSGGADSMNVLHAFIDNNIFLDEIVMQLPAPVEPKLNPDDLTNGNVYSEIKYSAVPHLNRYMSQLSGTKIKYKDFSKNVLELLSKDNWFEYVPMNSNLTVSGIGLQLAPASDEDILNLCGRGKKVAQIMGVDKPLVVCDGHNYFAYFLDLNANHGCPIDFTYAGNTNELLGSFYTTEFFYWTPDMPEIVVKQAQEIKRHCELDPVKKNLWMQAKTRHLGEFRSVMHPIIYPAYTDPVFQTEKPTTRIKRKMDQWFWDTAGDKVIDNYLSVINYLKKNVNQYHTNNMDIMNGLQGHGSPHYQL